MYAVRPVAASDIDALEALAAVAHPGVHTLPRARKTIERAVECSLAAFAATEAAAENGSDAAGYTFVLESGTGEIVGSAAIAATAGARGTFFAFRKDVLHQVSRDLDISHNVQALTLCSDLTACSQLSGFHLRHAGAAEAGLLSHARLLYAALAPQRFADKFFASMAGITDADGRSPFWEALGRKFFKMDFLQAERMIEGARNRTLIVELMPHYPVYVPLLPVDAQAAMGQVHAEAQLSCSLLSGEGFAQDQYFDIFDGGPILQAHRHALRAFARSTRRRLTTGSAGSGAPARDYLVATARADRFRAVVAPCRLPDFSDAAMLDEPARRRLDVVDGDALLCVRL